MPDLSAVPDGVWTLSVLEPAQGGLRAWVLELDTAAEVIPRVELEERASRGRLSGQIDGAPAGELVQVELRPVASPSEAFAFLAARPLGADGRFEFPAVPPGRYRVRAPWAAGATAHQEVEVEPARAAWARLAAESLGAVLWRARLAAPPPRAEARCGWSAV
ncbi:MAG: hypothetical protein AB7N76_25430 [Planctomycetota bacterium]